MKVGDENGVYSIALNNDGTKAAVGLGTGVLMVFTVLLCAFNCSVFGGRE